MLTADRQQGQEGLLSRMGGCWKGKRSQRRCGRVPEVGIEGTGCHGLVLLREKVLASCCIIAGIGWEASRPIA